MTPIAENFENIASIPNEDYTVFSTDEDEYWEITDAASVSGSNSMLLKNYYQDMDNIDVFESNAIDLSNLQDVHVTFKYSYAKRHSNDEDILYFKVTKNCGNNWINRETLKATDETLVTAPNHLGYFTPMTSEWEEAYVDNISASYLVENFRFKFEFRAGRGNNVYISMISIYSIQLPLE